MTDEITEELDEDQWLHQLSLRNYQIELIETSKKHNSIIFLPTGSGKTFIALQVLRSRMKDLMIPADKGGKIAVFLGTTKMLVNQLAEVVQENTNLNVKVFLGEMGVDDWTVNTWMMETAGAQVLVMVPAIFIIILQRKIVTLDKVSLMVFDECHHAVLNHPYRQIMQDFEFIPEMSRPLVIGLTATVLNSNPAKDGLDEVKILKRTFGGSFAKTDRLEEAMRHGTAAKDMFITYDISERSNGEKHILNLVKTAHSHLESFNISGVLERRAVNIVPKYCTIIGKKNVVVKEIRNIFKHMERAMKDMGLYPTSIVALYYYIRLERLKLLKTNPGVVTVIKYALTVLNLVRRTVFKYVPIDDTNNVRNFSSKKILKLIDIVDQYKDQENLKCIIMVEEKITAVVLAAMFNELCQNGEKFYKADFITGGLFSSVFEQEETKYEQKRLKRIVSSFRNNEFQFLFATDVIEEGVDIPNCNLVIKYDSPKDYRSYIQSKGRARFKDSKYIVLCNKEENSLIESRVNKYNTTQKNLLKALVTAEKTNSEIKEEEEEEEEYEEYEEKKKKDYVKEKKKEEENVVKGEEGEEEDEDEDNQLVEDEIFYIKGPDGPYVTGTRAISFVMRYCSRLPQDKFSFLAPICWYDSKTRRAYLKLPSSSPVQQTIVGDAQKNIKLAKKNVFLKTVKELHKAGEILDDLTLRSYKCKETEHKDVFNNLLEVSREKHRRPGASNTRRKYELVYAKNLSHCMPQPSTESYIHVIAMTPQFPRPNDSRTGMFYDLLTDSEGFAILSGKRLPEICEFPLFLTMGDFKCNLVVNAATVLLNASDMEKLRKFHFFIFNILLRVVNRLQVFDNEGEGYSFFIVPVKWEGDKPAINWDVIDDPVARTQNAELSEMITENPLIEDYPKSVVYPKYRQLSNSNKYYIVTALDRSQTPMSPFPSEDFDNYYVYFKNKYQLRIENTEQPLVEVKALSERLHFLKPRTASDIKRNRKYEDDNDSFREHLVPELCVRISFPALFWLKATLLPSALYRITTISHIDDMRKFIASKTKLGIYEKGSDFSWLPLDVDKAMEEKKEIDPQLELMYNAKQRMVKFQEENPELQAPVDLFRHMSETAPCDLIHYVKYFGLIPTENNSQSSQNEKEGAGDAAADEMVIEVPDLPLSIDNTNDKGPDLRDFVKVFTCKSANDIIDLERLEFLGDSFLKFSTAFYVFKKYDDNEGVLVSIKDKIISNKNLYCCGIRKGFQEVLLASEFEPKASWNPPLFCLPPEIKSLIDIDTDSFDIEYSFEIPVRDKLLGKLSQKTVKALQDFVKSDEKRSVYTPDENVLGRKTIPDKSIADCVEALLGLYIKECGLVGGFRMLNWLEILPETDGTYNEVMMKNYTIENKGDMEHTMRSLTEMGYEDLEKTLGYEFKNKFLLHQALMHPSVIDSSVLSYQRLEFLGDAVIDFLVTLHVHHRCPDLPPGQTTDIRMSLVNNVTMACLAVKHNIHKYLIHRSPPLMGAISQFVSFQKERNHKVDIALNVVSEEGEHKVSEAIEVPKALGDLFESLAGAIFLDSDNSLTTVWKTYYRLMKDTIELFIKDPPKSPIRKLYECCRPPPEFTYVFKDDGFVVARCKIIHREKEHIFVGRSSNRKSSKLSAAKHAVAFLEGFIDEIYVTA